MTKDLEPSDLISRADVKKLATKFFGHWVIFENRIDNLPSVPAVSLEKAEEITKRIYNETLEKVSKECKECKERLRSVSAERVGVWIRKEKEENDCDGHRAYYWHECSECGAKPPKNAWKQECFSPYCPNCGAYMVKGENE